MSNLPEDLEARLLEIGDQIRASGYGPTSISVSDEDAIEIDELRSRDYLKATDRVGFIGGGCAYVLVFTYRGKKYYESLKR